MKHNLADFPRCCLDGPHWCERDAWKAGFEADLKARLAEIEKNLNMCEDWLTKTEKWFGEAVVKLEIARLRELTVQYEGWKIMRDLAKEERDRYRELLGVEVGGP